MVIGIIEVLGTPLACVSQYMVCCQCSLLLGMEKVEQDFVKLGLVTLGGDKYGNATDLNI